ncbi:MAG TPA: PLDc N-terminal domain-containing protein [Chitinispirillaceae bacterium]|nr:PLDc N-terminal domain-containing protein [Chitinispirillaceae bacterium]
MKSWKTMKPKHKRVIILLAIVQITLLIAAMTDIWIRPSEQIKGSKTRWRLISLINFLGPLSYFFFGRKKV